MNDKWKYLLVFLIAFLVYGITTCIQFNGDVKPAALIPFLILNQHTLYFDGVIPHLVDPINGWGSLYNLIQVNGHWVSAYPVVTPILTLPIYIIHMLLMLVFPGGWEYYSVLSKSTASLMMAFTSVLFYSIVNRLFTKKTAILTTIIFAFGTLTWAISSQSLWQHGTSEILLIIMLLCIVKNEISKNTTNFVIIGLCSGLFIFNRPSDTFLLLPILWYVWIKKEEIYAFLFWAFVSGVPFLVYNIIIFGSVFGGYNTIATAYAIQPINIVSTVNKILVLFVSPNRGLFVYSPILILSVWGMWILWKSDKSTVRSVLLISIPSILLLAIFHSIHLDTLAGGYTYGPRYLIGAIPFLCLFCGYSLEKVRGKVWVIFGMLLAISIVVQAIGAWGYPYSEWNQRSDLRDKDRVWDIEDVQIIDSFWSIGKTTSISVFIWPTLPPPFGYWVLWERLR